VSAPFWAGCERLAECTKAGQSPDSTRHQDFTVDH
jgi:hypothetical protein